MSSQFAGVACAFANNLYNGIDISFLPTCPVGLELHRVRASQNETPGGIAIGTVEQNIFIPTFFANPNLKVKAVAAMFRCLPLCILSLPKASKDPMIIGAHEDTVPLCPGNFSGHKPS